MTRTSETVRSSRSAALLGVVPQDTPLFNDTIDFNIRYGTMDAPASAVEPAARRARSCITSSPSWPDGAPD